MNEQDIEIGMNALASLDEDIARAYKVVGPPPPRIRPNSFESLLSIIISQQISTDAAKAIMTRVLSLAPDMNASTLLTLDDQSLRDAGLSWRKVDYAKGLAQAVSSGRLNIAAFEQLDNEEVIEAIMSLRGFGRWSAEIYLMFSLRRPDVFPADDLALLVALGRLKRLEDRPTPKAARELIAHWTPYRSVGSLFLWHYYRGAPA